MKKVTLKYFYTILGEKTTEVIVTETVVVSVKNSTDCQKDSCGGSNIVANLGSYYFCDI